MYLISGKVGGGGGGREEGSCDDQIRKAGGLRSRKRSRRTVNQFNGTSVIDSATSAVGAEAVAVRSSGQAVSQMRDIQLLSRLSLRNHHSRLNEFVTIAKPRFSAAIRRRRDANKQARQRKAI